MSSVRRGDGWRDGWMESEMKPHELQPSGPLTSQTAEGKKEGGEGCKVWRPYVVCSETERLQFVSLQLWEDNKPTSLQYHKAERWIL